MRERRIRSAADPVPHVLDHQAVHLCCAAGRLPDPSVADGDVRTAARLEQAAPGALHLCHNQSGLRDYWAVAMLHGSPVEAPFGDTEAAVSLPGHACCISCPARASPTSTQNFRIVSDILQERTGRSFASCCAPAYSIDAGMAKRAARRRHTGDARRHRRLRGHDRHRFSRSEDRIVWTGDAGLGASLDDMIAWERHIDATRDDADALYTRLSAPVNFTDGKPAAYGFGLGRGTELGRKLTGHGGALRGWRSHRLYVPSERISVFVMFNHLADEHDAAVDLLAAVLGEVRPPASATQPIPDWLGAYTEPETGLAVRIDATADGQVRLRYGHFPERLELQADGTARCPSAQLRRCRWRTLDGSPVQNRSRLLPCEGSSATALPPLSLWEVDAELTVTDIGGVPVWQLRWTSVWDAWSAQPGRSGCLVLPCPRAFDHRRPATGRWPSNATDRVASSRSWSAVGSPVASTTHALLI